ncbi:MAG: ABC transporter permease [Synergistaceae bacterium]|jgi:ribose transport system permease protein|nr:ABC transporter permease [Synergistaceae bacterium]
MDTVKLTETGAAKPAEAKQKKKWKILEMRELNLMLILLVIIIGLSLTNEYFATWANLRVVIGSFSLDGIAVIGMTVILISGGIDLSVGSVMCLSMTICALLIRASVNPWLSALLALLGCTVVGLVMGLLITKVHLSHFIVTLCFLGIARGIVYALTTGTPISLVGALKDLPAFRFIGQGQVSGIIPMTVIIFLVLAVASEIFVRKSSLMRLVFYTGSNEKAAAFSGINVDRVKLATCVACSLFAGIEGIVYVNKFSGVPVSAGTGLEMTAIASAVIGGVSMNGGRGSVLGAILGLALMALVQNALTLFSAPPFWQDLIRYLIVLGAVLLDALQKNRAIRRMA